jgi:hypothetical protein
VLVSVLVLMTAGSLAFAQSRRDARPGAGNDRGASSTAAGAEAATRNLAAAWIARQVGGAATVSCDPVMCQALAAHGMRPADLRQLQPNAVSPLGSDLIVATPAIRGQFGSRLSSVFAPSVIARFGSGNPRIEIRVIAPHGAAAYLSALSADVLARKSSGAELLPSQRIAESAAARRQLAAGLVDPRLLIALAVIAAKNPVDIVAFGDSDPGAAIGGANPLRSVELAESYDAPGTTSAAFVRSVWRLLRGQQAPYRAVRAGTEHLAGGQAVFVIEFAPPIPLGLLGR